MSFNGVVQQTGDISMDVFVNMDTPNLGPSFAAFQNFYAAEVFVTSETLGLDNVQITSDTFLYFGDTVAGISDVPNLGLPLNIWTAWRTTQLDFGTEFDLSTLVVPQTISQSGTEWFTARGWQLGDGSAFDDDGAFFRPVFESNTVSVAPVPLPDSLPVLGLAVGTLFVVRCRIQRLCSSL